MHLDSYKGYVLTRDQEAFADWLKTCMGDFQQPTGERSKHCEDQVTPAESPPQGGASDGCGGHSHVSLCSHTKPQFNVPPPFHCYSIKSKKGEVSRQDWADWKLRNPHDYAQGLWYCANLAQASSCYSWRPFRIGGVVTPFSTLARTLQDAMSSGNVPATRNACESIFKWGGLNTRRAGPALAWIATAGALIKDIRDATALLQPAATGGLGAFNGTRYLMDSAMTKIYAAVALNPGTGAQDVLMYDGRVGSALCLLARQFIALHHPGCTPNLLGLDFLRAREKRRDPSQPGIAFHPLSNSAAGHQARAERARLAARIIQRALGIGTPSWRFAAFEKALFMIGYDVRYLCCGCLRP
jgi:hypothetical protein